METNSSSCITWDEAFYDDPLITKVESNTNEVNFQKSPMTQDLNPCNNENSINKLKLQPTIWTSPDLSMLDLNSPELGWFDSSPQTTLGNIISTPTPSLIPKSVTVEQHRYVQPYVEDLKPIHYNDNSIGDIPVEILMASSVFNSSETQYSVLITSNDFSDIMPQDIIIEDPQTVPSVMPSSPPLSLINMGSQEKIKLDEKRKRNRVAASKCRQRKLELKAKLGDNIKLLKNENTELTTEYNRLLEEISQLKQTVLEHMQNGCEFPVNSVDILNEDG